MADGDCNPCTGTGDTSEAAEKRPSVSSGGGQGGGTWWHPATTVKGHLLSPILGAAVLQKGQSSVDLINIELRKRGKIRKIR